MKRLASSAHSPPSFRPKIDPASLAIVSRIRQNDTEKVEERLLRLGRRIKAVKQAKMQQIMKNPQEPASMETIERLMQYQQIYRDHKMMLAKGQPERPTFNPVIDKGSEDIMAAKGKLDVTRPKQTDKSRKLTAPEFPFRPQLDPESLKIAAEKCSSSASRLLSPPNRLSSGPSKECTFRPVINKLNQRTNSPKDPRWKQLYELNAKNMETRAQAKFEAETQQVCPFRPSLSTSVSHSRGKSSKEVVERLLAWGKDKISKLNKMQRDKSDPAMEECTFAPSVSDMQKFTSMEWVGPPDQSEDNWMSLSNHIPSIKSFSPSHQSFKSITPRQNTEDHIHFDTKESLPLTTEEDSIDLEKLLKQLQGEK